MAPARTSCGRLRRRSYPFDKPTDAYRAADDPDVLGKVVINVSGEDRH